jgi:hypothetical protein
MVNRSIIVVVIFQKREHLAHNVRNVRIRQFADFDKMRQNIPHAIRHVQIVDQYVVDGIAEFREIHRHNRVHFFDDLIAHNIEYICRKPIDRSHMRKRMQLFQIQQVRRLDLRKQPLFFVGFQQE